MKQLLYIIIFIKMLSAEGTINYHDNIKNEFEEDMYKDIVVSIKNQNGFNQLSIQNLGSFEFIPYSSINVKPEYNKNVSSIGKFFVKNHYIFFPKEIKGNNIERPNFMFRTFDWLHIRQRNKILKNIKLKKFKQANEILIDIEPYYIDVKHYEVENFYYSLLQQMSSSLLDKCRSYRRTVGRLENIKATREWFKKRLDLVSHENYLKRRPRDIYASLADWILYAMLSYTTRYNWPEKTLINIEPTVNTLNQFRSKETYEFLQEDLEQVINILKMPQITTYVKKWNKKNREDREILSQWEEKIKNPISTDLNYLSSLLKTLHKIK